MHAPVQALLAARGQVEVGLALGALGGDVVVRHTGIALQGGALTWQGSQGHRWDTAEVQGVRARACQGRAPVT